MDMDIRNYLRVYRNALDKTKCEETVKELQQATDWFRHVYYDPLSKESISINGDKELDNSYCNVSSKQYIMERIWKSFKVYLEDLDMHWCHSWAGFSEVRFNRYNTHSVMNEHCDHIQSIFDGERKGIPFMTALGILNDDYKGGDLIFWQEHKIEVEVGDIIVFPSNYLYPHKVTPVTDGIRYSCVSWAW